MRKIDRLKQEGREAAKARGHRLGKFHMSKARLGGTAYCVNPNCEGWVCVVNDPEPNDIELGGSAAMNCPILKDS